MQCIFNPRRHRFPKDERRHRCSFKKPDASTQGHITSVRHPAAMTNILRGDCSQVPTTYETKRKNMQSRHHVESAEKRERGKSFRTNPRTRRASPRRHEDIGDVNLSD